MRMVCEKCLLSFLSDNRERVSWGSCCLFCMRNVTRDAHLIAQKAIIVSSSAYVELSIETAIYFGSSATAKVQQWEEGPMDIFFLA